MGNCNCGQCDCEKEEQTTEEKAEALKKSISQDIKALGFSVEETEEGIRISE